MCSMYQCVFGHIYEYKRVYVCIICMHMGLCDACMYIYIRGMGRSIRQLKTRSMPSPTRTVIILCSARSWFRIHSRGSTCAIFFHTRLTCIVY